MVYEGQYFFDKENESVDSSVRGCLGIGDGNR